MGKIQTEGFIEQEQVTWLDTLRTNKAGMQMLIFTRTGRIGPGIGKGQREHNRAANKAARKARRNGRR